MQLISWQSAGSGQGEQLSLSAVPSDRLVKSCVLFCSVLLVRAISIETAQLKNHAEGETGRLSQKEEAVGLGPSQLLALRWSSIQAMLAG